jgi:hypothetical protein
MKRVTKAEVKKTLGEYLEYTRLGRLYAKLQAIIDKRG